MYFPSKQAKNILEFSTHPLSKSSDLKIGAPIQWEGPVGSQSFWNAWFMCVFSGETGIGKSTLMDTLFNTKFESDPATHNEPGVRLKARSYELQESNVRLKLTIVDTVGFGDQINKDDR